MKNVQKKKSDNDKLQMLARDIENRLNQLGYQARLSHAYEILAASRGHRNWATMSSLARRAGCGSQPQIYVTLDGGWHLAIYRRYARSHKVVLHLIDARGQFQGAFIYDELRRVISYTCLKGIDGLENAPDMVGFSKMSGFMRDRAITVDGNTSHLGFIIDSRYTLHDLCNLQDNMEIRGDLNLLGAPSLSLPAGLYVEGALVVDSSVTKHLPSGLNVGSLSIIDDDGSILRTAADIKVRRQCIGLRSTERLDAAWLRNTSIKPYARFYLQNGVFSARELFGLGMEELRRVLGQDGSHLLQGQCPVSCSPDRANVYAERSRGLPTDFSRQEIADMLSIVEAEEQTIDGGGEFGPQESTSGWYARLLRTILEEFDTKESPLRDDVAPDMNVAREGMRINRKRCLQNEAMR
jgi:hypothetical protein